MCRLCANLATSVLVRSSQALKSSRLNIKLINFIDRTLLEYQHVIERSLVDGVSYAINITADFFHDSNDLTLKLALHRIPGEKAVIIIIHYSEYKN